LRQFTILDWQTDNNKKERGLKKKETAMTPMVFLGSK
jgi:hypothetical protein